MHAPRHSDAASDRPDGVEPGTTAPPGGRPKGKPRVRFTPWGGETELPLPLTSEIGVVRAPARVEERRREAPSAATAAMPTLNIRRHLARATARVGALLAVDLATLGAVLALLGATELLPTGGATVLVDDIGVLGGPNGVSAFALALGVGLAVTGNYGAGDYRRDARRLLAGVTLAVCLKTWHQLWATPRSATAQLVLLVLALGAALVLARYALDRVVRRHRTRTRMAARTVLVGREEDCRRLLVQNLVCGENGFHIVGYVESHPGANTAAALGTVDELEELLQRHDADTVVICGELDPANMARVVRAAMVDECELLAALPAFEAVGVRPTIVWRRGRPLIALRTEAVRCRGLVVKRAFDVVVASAMLVALSPLLVVLAIAIRRDSPGPAIFGQPRAGRHGRFFRCLKFRSMYSDAEERLRADAELHRRYVENDYKLPADEDPRITRMGRWLRRTSLDELPQLFNVLNGDMSLVGPRPVVREELNHYAGDEPLLLLLRPGLTGWWQVNGRSAVAYPERKYMELEYVQTWTPLRDLEILLRTVPAVLKQRGAH